MVTGFVLSFVSLVRDDMGMFSLFCLTSVSLLALFLPLLAWCSPFLPVTISKCFAICSCIAFKSPDVFLLGAELPKPSCLSSTASSSSLSGCHAWKDTGTHLTWDLSILNIAENCTCCLGSTSPGNPDLFPSICW